MTCILSKTKYPAPIFWTAILAVTAVKLCTHLYVNTIYGFHRDELLYLALGQHPAWGYWSNPPLIGWLGWVAQEIFGGSLFAVRLLPTLGGCGIVVLTGLLARELGGGRYAQLLAAITAAVSPAFLRTSMLFQPVVFDILGWALLCYLFLRYLNSNRNHYLLFFGIALGIFFLNKYLVLLFIAALAPALALTPARNLLTRRITFFAAGLALLVMAPNLIWQVANGFPVINHMQALQTNQLVNVQPADFLSDQLVMHFTGLLVWVPGVWFLWKSRNLHHRIFLYLAAGVILLLLLLKGKHYYSLGIYPALMAAGGVFWEKTVTKTPTRVVLPVVMIGLLLPMAPLAIPLFAPPKMVEYCQWAREALHFDVVTRWEDGRHHSLPQDFADMLGWPEIGQAAVRAYRQVPTGTPVLIYGENYGQAGAVDYFGRQADLPPAVSFADSYRLWMPSNTNAETLIYINDELGEDVQAIFSDIREIGSVRDSFAREFGTTVYLCRKPRRSFAGFWAERVQEIRGQ